MLRVSSLRPLSEMSIWILCTSGTSRVLTVASSQRSKIETLIPAPADCEVRSVVKYLNAQSTAPFEIRQLCQFYDHTRSTHLLKEFRWKVFNHDPPYSPDLALSDLHLSLNLKKFLSGQCQRFQNDREAEMRFTVIQSQAADFYDTGYKSWSHGMTIFSIPEVNI